MNSGGRMIRRGSLTNQWAFTFKVSPPSFPNTLAVPSPRMVLVKDLKVVELVICNGS
jgi:hypothetical protein